MPFLGDIEKGEEINGVEPFWAKADKQPETARTRVDEEMADWSLSTRLG